MIHIMTPQVKRIFFFIIVVGINVANSKKILHTKEKVTTERNDDEESENSTIIPEETTDSIEALDAAEDERKQSERKPQKRGQRAFSKINNEQEVTQPKSKSKRKTIEYPHPKEAPYPNEAPYPSEAPYPNEAPYSNKAPYPKETSLPSVLFSPDHGNIYQRELNEPEDASTIPFIPLVASGIDIMRAVPFENDYITRHYASKFHYPPATLGSEISKFSPKINPVPFLGSEDSFDHSSPDNDRGHFSSQSSFTESNDPVAPSSKPYNYQSSPNFLQTPDFFPNEGDELNRFGNPVVVSQEEPAQSFIPGSPVNTDINRSDEPPGFVPWTPPEFNRLKQFAPVDRFVPGQAQAPSIGFNVEVSEIGEPAFIVPENVGKVDITIPPPFAPLRTHGLTINDAQITRNEVRKDNGEFISSYTTAEGTERLDSGSLVPTADGKDKVLVLKGSYSYTSPEGVRVRVDYTADETGYRATQVPVSEDTRELQD